MTQIVCSCNLKTYKEVYEDTEIFLAPINPICCSVISFTYKSYVAYLILLKNYHKTRFIDAKNIQVSK